LKCSVILLKEFESNLVKLRYDYLLDFLLNDIHKSGFFHNANYNKFCSTHKMVRIKKGLINSICNEYIQEKKFNPNIDTC